MKIIKHFEQSGGLSSANPVQGVLLGLLEGDTLEITNCFSFPADEDADVHDYQKEMIKKLRKINIDQLPVGFYQSSVFGFFITRELVEDMHVYQSSVEESICLIYGQCQFLYRLIIEFFQHPKNNWENFINVGIQNERYIVYAVDLFLKSKPKVKILLERGCFRFFQTWLKWI